MSPSHVPILIPLVCLLAALLIPLVGRLGPAWAHGLALLATALASLTSGLGLFQALTAGRIPYFLGGWPPPVGIELVLDPLSAFLALVLTGVSVFVLLHARLVVDRELPGKAIPFYSAAMLLVGGLLGIVITDDLFNLYVFLEISSLASYALAAVGNRRAPVSAFRYLILGTVGASFYLLGLGFLLLETGTLNMADMGRILAVVAPNQGMILGLILITVGIGLKMGLFPLHGWLPDAYTYASSAATALLAPIGTKVAAYVLLRLFFHAFQPFLARLDLPIVQVVGYLGVAGILWGSIMAVAQRDLKRMLAYSSVGQIGYIAAGIGLASPLGFIGAVLHILNHACMKACLFLVSANFRTRLDHHDIERLDHSLRLRMPWTSAAFVLAALSMIGLPPTAGFFSKWYLILGAVEKSNWLFAGAILLSSLLNAIYFFRVVERLYLRPAQIAERSDSPQPAAHAAQPLEVSPSMLIPTLALSSSLLIFGLANVPIVNRVIQPMLPWN